MRVTLSGLIFSIICHTAPNVLAAAQRIPPYEADYDIRVFGLPMGQSFHRLHYPDAQHYVYEIRSTPKLPLIPYQAHNVSRGLYQNLPQPHSYDYAVHSPSTKLQYQLFFDWTTMVVRTYMAGSIKVYPLTPKTQDHLSHQLLLRHRLLEGTLVLNYSIAEQSTIHPFHFTDDGTETLSTKLGHLQTVIVTRHRGDKKTKIWLAVDYAYLQVRIEHYKANHRQGIATIKRYKALSPVD